MSSFWDRVDKVNERKKAEEEEKKKKPQESTSSSFWDRVDKINNGDIVVNSSMSREDVTNWASGASNVGQRAYNFLKTDGYKLDDKYESEINSYLDKADHVAQYLRANKKSIANYDELISSHYDAVNNLKNLRDGIGKSNEFYSQWDSADSFNADLQAQKDYEEKASYDLEAGKREIEELEKKKTALAQKYRGIITGDQAAITYLTGPNTSVQGNNNYLGRIEGEESDVIRQMKELEDQINQKKQYLTLAERVQYGIQLSSVADPNSENYDPEFNNYTGYVAGVNYGLGGKPYFDDETYAYINNPTVIDNRVGGGEISARDLLGWNDTAMSKDSPYYNGLKAETIYDFMTDEEVDIYNYYYNKHGKDAAKEYIEYLSESLNARKAQKDFEKYYEGNKLLELGHSITAGLDQFGSGIANLINGVTNGDEYIPTTYSQYLSSMVREDLADVDLKWYNFKEGEWDDANIFGSSLGQTLYDVGTTTANMAPSILVSTAVGLLNPVAGAWIGATLMGASAAGNAYADALNRGLDKSQAATYGVAIGVSEALLEKALGGISKFGGTSAKITKAVSGIDNALLRWSLRFGGSFASEALEEGLQEILDPIFQNAIFGTDEDVNWSEVAYSALLGGLSAGVFEGNSIRKDINKEQSLKTEYEGKTDALIQEGLESDIDTESFNLAKDYQAKIESGKSLTGAEIRNLLAANQEQIAPKDLKKIQKAAEARLTELGQTKDVQKLAELATKYATGQKLSKADKAFLANNKNGNRVAQELIPENIMSGEYTSEWAEGIGTKQVNKLAYNIKNIIEQMANPAVYKPLSDRIGEDEKVSVSDNGKATISGTDEEISIDKKVEVVDFVKDKKTGKITDIIINANGKQVKASEIDFADADQAYLFSAVKHIENITPADAQVIIRDYDPSSGISVGEYLNGVDEAYTYGYHGYSEADMKSGLFTTKLSDEKSKGAYELGKLAKKNKKEAKSEAIKRMRTAVEAETEKVVAEGKPAPEPKKMAITYNEGNGVVRDFEKAGMKLSKKQRAGVEVAKILHKLGLGTNFEFFESKLSGTLTDKDGNPARVFINDAGVEESAPAGVYSLSDGTIRIDLNAYNGRGLTLYALAHELTHFIQQWSTEKYEVLAEYLVSTYEKTGLTMHQRVLREQARLKGIRGKDISYNKAYDEVVANAMMKMFDDGKLVERLTELKAKDKNLAIKLWEGFKEILNKLLGVYQSDPGVFYDTEDLMQMKEDFEVLQGMFAEALVDASENFQANLTVSESQTLTEAGIGIDVETGSVYSLNFSTATNDTIQVGKKSFDAEAISQLVAKVTGRSITDARKWVNSEMAIANIVMQNPEFLDFEADNRYDAIKKNSDYPQGTVDLSNLCPKREEFTTMFDMLQKKYPNKLFTAQDVADMRKILSENGITVACGACFVEDRRQLIGEIADTFINMWKEAAETGKPLQKTNAAGNKVELLVTKALAKQYGLTAGTKIMATDTYIPNQYDLTTYEGFKKLEKNHPTIAMAFNRYNNSRGQQSARLIEGRAEYKRQILGWSDAKVRSVNNNGGLRIFSFSDFEVVHLLDLVQVIIDCAAKGVKIQGYTKIPAFAKLVRGTGIKLNRSLIPKGDYGYHMENGKVVLDYDTTEGIDINDKNFMDESDNPNVGNIVIGINPTQIGAAMLDPFIDYIIPFHSNKAKEILRKLGTGEWWNYKESQHEKDIATGTSSKHNVNIYTEVINKYHPTNKVEFVEAFLKECKRQGKIPRYAEFLNVDANGDYAYREGYHKLLVDFKMFDAEGNILPQGNITPNLDENFMKELLNAEIDKKQNYEFPQEVYDAIDKKFGEQYSSQETDIDRTYIDYGDIASEKSAIDNTVARLVSQGKFVEIAADDVEKHKTSGEWDSRKGARQYLKRILKGFLGKSVRFNRNIVRAEAYLTKEGFNHSSVGLNTPEKAAAFSKYYALIANSEYSYSSKNDIHSNANIRIGGKIDWDSFVAVAMIDGKPYPVVFKVRTIDQDIRSQIYKMATKNEIGSTHDYGQQEDLPDALPNYGGTPTSVDKVTQPKPKVKKNSGKELQSSQETDLDTEGMSDEAKAIIKNLEIRAMGSRYRKGVYASYSADRIVRELNNSSANKLDYAKSYIAWVEPLEFLYATTISQDNRAQIEKEAGELDLERLRKQTQPIHLTVDFETGKIVGHEGRHRMIALHKAGVEKVAVIFDAWNDDRYNTKPVSMMRIGGQEFDRYHGGIDFYVHDMLPLSKRYAAAAQKLFSEVDGSLRFSTQETDNISNRDMLANAFETLAQNSEEYKMIQDYKNHIRLLNEYEDKLSKLNAEIREITFGTEGERDYKRLRELQAKAKEMAGHINRHDKKLIEMEASAPLRKVIEQERKKEAQKTREHIGEILQNKKARAEQSEIRHKIQRVVNELNQLLLNGDKKRHVPESMKKAVADALLLVNMDTVGAEARVAKYAALIANETDPDKIDAYRVTMENIQRQGEEMGQKLKDLREAYEEISDSDDPDIANAYDPVIAGNLKELASTIGNTSLRDMSLSQLEDVYTMYKMVLTRVRDANKSFLNEKNEAISSLASSVVGEVRSVGGEHKYRASVFDSVKKFFWNNQKPIYAMESIGSNTLTDAFMELITGEGTYATDVSHASKFADDRKKKYKYDSWDFKKMYRFESTSGLEFELSLEQIMSLYAYSKREQAHDHLRLGGFVFDSNIEVSAFTKDGKELKKFDPRKLVDYVLKYKVNTADAHQISPNLLADITGKLSKEQMAFVDEMQKYLSDVMGAKGNEVSMKMYGVKLFKEKFYFPLKSAKQFLFEQNEVAGEVKIKNSGFTNKVVAKANNPVILNNFMDVWANHVHDMSMYHSFVLPLEDFNRIFNYKSPKKEGQPPISVKGTIQSAYGPAAESYVKQLITDLNGGARSDPRESTAKALMARFKKAAVFASNSVVIQQPSAILRAQALVDAKYFDINPKFISMGKLWEEAKRYAPVAIIKEMGHFDMDTSRGTVDFIKGDKTFMNKVDDLLSIAPAKADEWAWVQLWAAVKKETAAKRKDLTVGSDEFLKAAGKRFTEVIIKTQVYDSTLARSANMRSKSALMSMATAFMAEPTTSINMLENGIRMWKRGYKKAAFRHFSSVYSSVIANAILVSIIYGMRDDDEEETFLEKYFGSLTTEILDGLNPLTYYPWLKDGWSLLQGFDVERSDMSLLNDVFDALNKFGTVMFADTEDMNDEQLEKHRQMAKDSAWALVDGVASLLGIPEKNIRRDINSYINTVKTLTNGLVDNRTSFWDEVTESVKNSIPFLGWAEDESKTDKLYDAIISGDKSYLVRLKSAYVDKEGNFDKDKYATAVRTALRENDSRIKEAALAEINGNPSERVRIARLIIADGFVQDDVVAAINSEINALTPKEEDSGTDKKKGFYTTDNLVREFANGDTTSAKAAKSDIISTAIANGKTKEQAEKDFMSNVSSSAREAYEKNWLSESKAKKLLMEYAGEDEDGATSKVNYWTLCKLYPNYKDLFTEARTKNYHEYVKPAGISMDTYVKFLTKTNGLSDIKDANGKVKLSKQDQVIDVIDAFPITRRQKNALFLAAGYKESTLSKVRWS